MCLAWSLLAMSRHRMICYFFHACAPPSKIATSGMLRKLKGYAPALYFVSASTCILLPTHSSCAINSPFNNHNTILTELATLNFYIIEI